MKRIKIMGLALVAILAMSALVAGTASAKESKNLVLKDSAGIIPAGTTSTLESTNLVTVTAAGNLECEHAYLPTVLSEQQRSTKVLGTSTEDLTTARTWALKAPAKRLRPVPPSSRRARSRGS